MTDTPSRSATPERVERELAGLWLAAAMKECGFAYDTATAESILDYLDADNDAFVVRSVPPSEPPALNVERLAWALEKASDPDEPRRSVVPTGYSTMLSSEIPAVRLRQAELVADKYNRFPTARLATDPTSGADQ